jgi:DNA-directed RNA polymerase subunit E'/Rpb7
MYRMATAAQQQQNTTGAANCESEIPRGGKTYLYSNNVLTTRVQLHITQVGNSTKENLEEALKDTIGNRCTEHGFIRKNSIRIQSYTAGKVNSDQVEFHVAYASQCCLPTEGQVLTDVQVKNSTKAGLHCHIIDEDGNTPLVVFIAKDHNKNNQEFENVNPGDKINACVLGVRFELNDPYVSTIARLVPGKFANKFQTQQHRIRIGGDTETPEDIEDLDNHDPSETDA